MTTDITELAQREKFEAWWEREYKHLESSKYTDAVPHIKYGFWMAYQAGGAELVEALEKAQRYITELNREHQTFRIVGVRSVKASLRVENSKSRFIELWLRPGIFLPHKRPEHSMSYYAGMAVLTGTKAEIY